LVQNFCGKCGHLEIRPAVSQRLYFHIVKSGIAWYGGRDRHYRGRSLTEAYKLKGRFIVSFMERDHWGLVGGTVSTSSLTKGVGEQFGWGSIEIVCGYRSSNSETY